MISAFVIWTIIIFGIGEIVFTIFFFHFQNACLWYAKEWR